MKLLVIMDHKIKIPRLRIKFLKARRRNLSLIFFDAESYKMQEVVKSEIIVTLGVEHLPVVVLPISEVTRILTNKETKITSEKLNQFNVKNTSK